MNMRATLLTLSLCTVLSISATAASPVVRVDYDHSANFSAYKTFAFVSPPGTEVDGYPKEITQNIQAAVQREMEARGYRRADSHPDLFVNFSAELAKKTKKDTGSNQPIGYYGYRNAAKVPVYKAWSSYTYDQQTKDYVEGTLNVELVDAKKSQLVWEGVGIGEVKDTGKQISETKANIDEAVKDIFSKFSFRAGS